MDVIFRAPSRVSLQIGQDLLDNITDLCKNADSHETGGILYGSYSDDHLTAVVTGITRAPTDSASGNVWFKRRSRCSPSAAEQALESSYVLPGRVAFSSTRQHPC